MHALLINDTSLGANIGGRANAVALIRMLKHAGVTEISSIYGYDINPYMPGSRRMFITQHYLSLFVPAIVPKLKSKIFGESRTDFSKNFKVPKKWSEFDELAYQYLNADKYADFIKMMKSVDLVIVNGEGTIYGDRDESIFILFLLYLAKKYLDKPAIIVNHTLDADNGELRKIVDNLYPILDDIVFREHTSLNNFGYFPKARFAADTAFVYKAASKDTLRNISSRVGYYDIWPFQTYDFDMDKPYICVGGSSIFFRNDMKHINPTTDFFELCKALKEKFGQVVCVSSDLPDETFLKEVSMSLKLPFISCRTSILQTVDIIGNARVFLSGRWHPTIFAINSGVPVVAFSAHNFKMRALLDLMGIKDDVYDAEYLSNQKKELISRIEYYFDNNSIREGLSEKAALMERSAYDNVNFVEKLSVQ